MTVSRARPRFIVNGTSINMDYEDLKAVLDTELAK